MSGVRIHPTAEVDAGAIIGEGCRIWHQAQVREGAELGAGCIIGKGAYIDAGVKVGANCKVQNYACVYHGTTLEEGVFVGPHAVFTNDQHPRAINPDGSLKGEADWQVGATLVRRGAAIGARAVVLPGISIGTWALVAAGSVVTKDIPDHGIAAGHPARLAGWACACGRRLSEQLVCVECDRSYERVERGLREK